MRKVPSAKYGVPNIWRLTVLFAVTITATSVIAQQAAPKHKPPAPPELPANVVTLASASPLYDVEIMVRAGSAEDPRGKEGTAALVGRMVLEGEVADLMANDSVRKAFLG